jgi:acetylglutamate kinase
MVYGGLVNKRIVAALQQLGCNAIGLTGADGNCIRANKRPVGSIDYGYVGDIHADGGVNVSFIGMLLQSGVTPVFAPLTHDGNGQMLNTNADTIAQELAKSLSAIMPVRLIYCFEKDGVLMHADDEASVIPHVDAALFEKLQAEQVIIEGMIPKLSNALAAVKAGVTAVTIGKADDLCDLIKGTKGTYIK